MITVVVTLLLAKRPDASVHLVRSGSIAMKVDDVKSVRLAPNGGSVLVFSGRSAKLISLPSGRIRWEQKLDDAAFTPDAKLLIASAGSRLTVIRASDGSKVALLPSKPGTHIPLSVASDGATAVAADGPNAVSEWSLSSFKRSWTAVVPPLGKTVRMPPMSQADEKYGDKLRLIALSGGGAVVADSMGWAGEPMYGTWWMGHFDKDGCLLARCQDTVFSEQIEALLQLDNHRIGVLANGGDSAPKSFEIGSMNELGSPNLPNMDYDNMWKGGDWVFAHCMDNDQPLVAAPIGTGQFVNLDLHRKKVLERHTGDPFYWPETVQYMDVSSDGTTLVLNEGDHMAIYAIVHSA